MPRVFDRYPDLEMPMETVVSVSLSPALDAVPRSISILPTKSKAVLDLSTVPSKPKQGIYIEEIELSSLDGDEESESIVSPASAPPFWTDSDDDSLEELSDGDHLDAFLATKGTLSHWPTPPLAPQQGIILQPVDSLDLNPENSLGTVNLHRVLDSPCLTGSYLSSPSPSDSDSLNGLSDDDLDALLAARGSLSKWPTPPLSAKDSVRSYELPLPSLDGEIARHAVVARNHDENDSEDYGSECEIDHLDVATVLTGATEALPAKTDWSAVLSLEDLLIRADLPPDLYALTLNILSRYTVLISNGSAASNTDTQENLLPGSGLNIRVAAAMNLAATYTEDHNPSSSWWLAHILCDETVTVRDFERAKITILKALDWRLHDLCSPESLADAWRRLERWEIDGHDTF